MVVAEWESDIEPMVQLSRDLAKAASTLTLVEVRYLVDYYYQIQEGRKRADNQVRSMEAEPHELLRWVAENTRRLEDNIKRALDKYSRSSDLGLWCRSITGIGPVITAGLLAHIDIAQAPTAGHIWRFAGLDPTDPWGKGEKRPWNADLKRLCWLIGESFVKVSGNDSDVYGKMYVARKVEEIARNEAGAYAEQAAEKLRRFNIRKDKEAYLWYSGCLTADNARTIAALDPEKRQGAAKRLAGAPGSGLAMLPPAHIHSRAKRVAVKLFLAHFHHVAYELRYGTPPPMPYVITHLGHAHYRLPPNWPMP